MDTYDNTNPAYGTAKTPPEGWLGRMLDSDEFYVFATAFLLAIFLVHVTHSGPKVHPVAFPFPYSAPLIDRDHDAFFPAMCDDTYDDTFAKEPFDQCVQAQREASKRLRMTWNQGNPDVQIWCKNHPRVHDFVTMERCLATNTDTDLAPFSLPTR